MVYRSTLLLIVSIFFGTGLRAQQASRQDGSRRSHESKSLVDNAGNRDAQDTGTLYLSLKDCIAYALKNQPSYNQAHIDEAIANLNKNIALSGWLPQVTGAAGYQHYFQLPVAFIPENGVLTPITSGVSNYGTPQITVSQNIFSPDVLLAQKVARLSIQNSKENTRAVAIDLVTNVSKAFYDILLSMEQIGVYQEDTARLRKNKDDAYNRYLSGIADKVDFKQATISFNNSLSQLKTADEAVQSKFAILRQLIGTAPEQSIKLQFDTAQMMQDVYIDTLEALRIEKRPEFQELQLSKMIQHQNTLYYRYNFLPSVSAMYNYDYEYENNSVSNLFSAAYPNSYLGVQLSIPIFTGFRRVENLHKSQFQEKRIDWDEVNLRLGIYSQYKQALAAYKSNLFNFHVESENVNMAREVYNIVKLQYKEGVKAYLDVIVAETDLRTSEINYLNALFQVLESKMDLERAMGDVPVTN